MYNEIYLYNNSQAQGPQGFIKEAKRKRLNRKLLQCSDVTTSVEFIHARKFTKVTAAASYIKKYKLAAIMFLRIEE